MFMLMKSLPDDTRDDSGIVLDVSKLAYLKFVFQGFIWITLTSIVFIASNIAIAYLDTGMLGSFLFAIYQIMFISNFVILPLLVIRTIQRLIMSKEMIKLIERGVAFT